MNSSMIGNVYAARGGRPNANGPTKWWLVVTVVDRVVHLLGLNEAHEVCSSTSYGIHVLCGRELVAHVSKPITLGQPVEFDPVLLGQKIDWVEP